MSSEYPSTVQSLCKDNQIKITINIFWKKCYFYEIIQILSALESKNVARIFSTYFENNKFKKDESEELAIT